MIEFLKTGDFNEVQHIVLLILVMWLIMVLAVCVDLWAGINSAKARKEKIYSHGLRRTFSKLGDYWRIQVMALIFDLIGSCMPWYSLPDASMIITAAIVLIEGRSVWENERAKKSNVAKIPDAIRDIINCSTAKSAEELLEKIRKEMESNDRSATGGKYN